MYARLFVTWIIAALAYAAALAGGREPPVGWLVAAVMLWGGISVAGTRSALLLGGARKGTAVMGSAAPAHRLWRGGALGLLVGAALGGALAAAASVVLVPTTWAQWATLLSLTSVLAFALGAALAARALSRPRAPRSSTLLRWILFDTALPVGVIAALAGVVIVRLRYGGLEQVSAVDAARHLAVTLLLYGVLLGLGGGLKTAREKLAGLVEAPAPAFEAPGAVVSGAALGIVVLVVLPRALAHIDVGALVVTKAALGLVVGTALCALGALRGAHS